MVDINYLVERRLGQLKGFLDFSVLDGVKYKAYKGGLYDYIITSNGDIYRIEAGDMLRKIKPHKSRGYWYFNVVLETGKYKQILGHKDIKTTTKYAHVLADEKRDALLKVFS